MKKILLIIAMATLNFEANAQNITYVNIDAVGNNDGTNWVDAYDNLSTALSAAPQNSEVWVAKGLYKPTYGGLHSNFSWTVDSLEVYGGFDGTETLITQRNIEVNQTILSGDAGVSGDITDNLYTVLKGPSGWAGNVYTYSLVDGFVVEEGNARSNISSDARFGGAVYLNNKIDNLVFSNCTFLNNRGEAGGAICVRTLNGDIGVTFTNCKFDGNKSRWASCMNFSAENGNELNVTVANCLMENNEIVNTFSNGAGTTGLIYLYTANSSSYFNMVNTTVVNNLDIGSATTSAQKRLIMFYRNGGDSAQVYIDNSIFWNNDANTILGSNGQAISAIYDTLSIANSITEDTLFESYATITNVTHNDPMFTDLANGDFTIPANSPAVNKGSTTGIADLIPNKDLAGNKRISGSKIDIGCYEYQEPIIDGIEDNSYSNISLYPNPTSGLITITSAEKIKNLRVFDFTGRVIITSKQNKLDMSDFENGIYFVEINTNKGISIKKVVKQS